MDYKHVTKASEIRLLGQAVPLQKHMWGTDALEANHLRAVSAHQVGLCSCEDWAFMSHQKGLL